MEHQFPTFLCAFAPFMIPEEFIPATAGPPWQNSPVD